MRVSSFLILACIGTSFWAWQQEPAFAERHLIFTLESLQEGRGWTLIAALLVHANPLHLFGNMIFLFVFGRTLENTVGGRSLAAIFFSAGFASFFLSLYFLPRGTGMLGASGAIFALAGCVMLVRPLRFSWLFLAPQGLIALVYFIYNLVLAYEKSRIPGYDPQIAYIAHVIGFIAGLPFGIAWSEQWKRNFFITLLLLGLYAALVSGALRLLRP